MQRIIQINISGSIIPMEEDAYQQLRKYIESLERRFRSEEGRDEIMQDIEARICELFRIRLQTNVPSISIEDVRKVIDTLGPAHNFGDDPSSSDYLPVRYSAPRHDRPRRRRIFRNPYDKMLGGVCGGIATYFEVDSVLVRLLFALTFFFLGTGLLVYLIAWAIIPLAKRPEELREMEEADPLTVHDMARNMQSELLDLKKRAEEMSRELRDFFSKKKN